MVSGIAHVALYTDKFEETIKFYEDTFDAENLGCFMTARRGCWLKIGDSFLEIFESEALPAEGAFKHIAIQVDNIDEMIERCLKNGASMYQEKRDITLALKDPKDLTIVFVEGVNGEQIELVADR